MAKPLLPDDLWDHIAPLLPPSYALNPGEAVRRRRTDLALTGILFVLKTKLLWE